MQFIENRLNAWMVDILMRENMDEWMDGRIDGWNDKRIDRLMAGWMDG
jgi:hypothetical protein